MRGRELRTRFETQDLWLQFRDAIAARIDAGDWKPGAIMPNEQELAREYGISQGTARTALRDLAQQGYIERIQGRGTYVVDREAAQTEQLRRHRVYAEAALKTAITARGGDIDAALFDEMINQVALALHNERARLLNGRKVP